LAVGGQADSTSRIENYLGFPNGIGGWILGNKQNGGVSIYIDHDTDLLECIVHLLRLLDRHRDLPVFGLIAGREVLNGA
jgi:hypothetical protein